MEQSDGGKREEEEGGAAAGPAGCCMCGDVGFADHLRRCPEASCSRLQHTYCSRMYPDIEMLKWRCEWCLHEQAHHQQQQQGAGNVNTATSSRLKKRKENTEGRDRDRKAATSMPVKKQHFQQRRRVEASSSMPASLCTRWTRKPTCNVGSSSSSSSRRMAGRRYKLLADVH